MASSIKVLMREVDKYVVPELLHMGFHLQRKEDDLPPGWHFRRMHKPSDKPSPFDSLDITFVNRTNRNRKCDEIHLFFADFDHFHLERALKVFPWERLWTAVHERTAALHRIRPRPKLFGIISRSPEREAFAVSRDFPKLEAEAAATNLAKEIVTVLPQVQLWFSSGTCGPNVSETFTP